MGFKEEYFGEGKERRKKYKRSKAVSKHCRNNNLCSYCRSNRLYQFNKYKQAAEQQLKRYNKDEEV